MDILVAIAALVIGYLVGSVSFSRVVTHIVSPETDLQAVAAPVEGTDEKLHMSGISATSVRIKLGPKYGCLASLLDMVKVGVLVAAFRYLFPDSPAPYLAATAGIIGHNWPLYYGFHGGYGHSAIYGALLVIEWTAVPVSFVGTGILYLISRKLYLAMFGGVALVIPWLWYLDYDAYALLYAGVSSAAYLIRILPDFRTYRHIENKKASHEENAKEGIDSGDS